MISALTGDGVDALQEYLLDQVCLSTHRYKTSLVAGRTWRIQELKMPLQTFVCFRCFFHNIAYGSQNWLQAFSNAGRPIIVVVLELICRRCLDPGKRNQKPDRNG
jgi:hypothetical protein